MQPFTLLNFLCAAAVLLGTARDEVRLAGIGVGITGPASPVRLLAMARRFDGNDFETSRALLSALVAANPQRPEAALLLQGLAPRDR